VALTRVRRKLAQPRLGSRACSPNDGLAGMDGPGGCESSPSHPIGPRRHEPRRPGPDENARWGADSAPLSREELATISDSSPRMSTVATSRGGGRGPDVIASSRDKMSEVSGIDALVSASDTNRRLPSRHRSSAVEASGPHRTSASGPERNASRPRYDCHRTWLRLQRSADALCAIMLATESGPPAMHVGLTDLHPPAPTIRVRVSSPQDTSVTP